MKSSELVPESDLAALAKKFRVAAGKSKSDVARELGVTVPSVFSAEEEPDKSFLKLRCRIIEACSNQRVSGPFYRLDKK